MFSVACNNIYNVTIHKIFTRQDFDVSIFYFILVASAYFKKISMIVDGISNYSFNK